MIGADLHNEPHHAIWGDQAPSGLLAMYVDVSGAIGAVNLGVLMICEGPQDYRAAALVGDLRPMLARLVRLRVPDKVVYSVHTYPYEISATWPDAGLHE